MPLVDDVGALFSWLLGKVEIARHEIAIFDVQGGSEQTSHIHHRIRPEENPVGIDNKHSAVGYESPQDRRWVNASDSVQDDRLRARLINFHELINVNAETFPVIMAFWVD